MNGTIRRGRAELGWETGSEGWAQVCGMSSIWLRSELDFELSFELS